MGLTVSRKYRYFPVRAENYKKEVSMKAKKALMMEGASVKRKVAQLPFSRMPNDAELPPQKQKAKRKGKKVGKKGKK